MRHRVFCIQRTELNQRPRGGYESDGRAIHPYASTGDMFRPSTAQISPMIPSFDAPTYALMLASLYVAAYSAIAVAKQESPPIGGIRRSVTSPELPNPTKQIHMDGCTENCITAAETRKLTHNFPVPLDTTKFCYICQRFGRN